MYGCSGGTANSLFTVTGNGLAELILMGIDVCVLMNATSVFIYHIFDWAALTLAIQLDTVTIKIARSDFMAIPTAYYC